MSTIFNSSMYNPSYSGVLYCGGLNYTVDFNDYQLLKNVYECGQNVADGRCFEKSNSGTSTATRPSLSTLLTFLLLLTLVLSSPSEEGSDSFLTIESLGSPDSAGVFKQAFVLSKGIYVNDTNTYIEVVKPAPYSTNSTNSDDGTDETVNLEKRDSGLFWQYQAAQSGYWWSPWYPVSDCSYCDNAPSGVTCTRSLGYSFSYSWSITAGAGIDFGAVSATTSYSITKTYGRSDEFGCTWGSGDGPAQIWFQQKVYWADMQKQQCVYVVTPTDIVTSCDPWSKYYRANAPIKSFNKGCSVGSSHAKC